MIIEKINSFLEEKFMQERDAREDGVNVFRASNSLKCPRQLAYKKLGYPGDIIPARGLRVLEMGNTVEAQLVGYLKDPLFQQMFPDLQFSFDQLDLTYKTKDGVVISGHIDGLAQGRDGTTYLIEFKSINTRGFSRQVAEKKSGGGVESEPYKGQANIYLHALNLNEAIFIFYDKNDSNMVEVSFYKDPELMLQIENEFKQVYDATDEHMPDRKFEPITVPANLTVKQFALAIKNGETPETITKLQWQCSYCAFNGLCYPDFEKQLIKGRVVYVLQKKEKE